MGDVLEVTSPAGDAIISAPDMSYPDPGDVCITKYKDSMTTSAKRLADASWGGRRAVVADIRFYDMHFQLWCVATPLGSVQTMGTFSEVRSTYEEVNAAIADIAANTTWK